MSADHGTYTNWIDNTTWKLNLTCLDFNVFEGSTTGKRIYKDVMAVLQKYQGEAKDTIVFDTTGDMEKLGRYLHKNGKEHGYCTDHHLHHLVAKVAFEREIILVCDIISFIITSSV
jgi:hypothetical protein